MSGDTQPRKRKDKKRKKEESEHVSSQSHGHTTNAAVSDDVNIHVHKDSGTGGGICAKIIFFLLFSALISLIVLIITEHRGVTDVDVVETESKYSEIFKGWVDETPDAHDDDDDEHEAYDISEEHQEGELSEEQHDEDEEHDDDNEADDADSEEELNQVSDENEEDNQTEEQDANNSEYDDETPESEEKLESQEKHDSEEHESQERQESEEPEGSEEFQGSEEHQGSEEREGSEERQESEERGQSEERGDNVDDVDESNERDLDEENAVYEEPAYISKDKNDDKSDEKEDKIKKTDKTKQEDNEETSEGSYSLLKKLAVGFSILVVAQTVLVRKWKSAPREPEDEEGVERTPDLSRRNTLVSPPPLQEIEQDLEYDDEEYSDEELDVESDEDNTRQPRNIRQKYQELRSSYSRSRSPESEPEYQDKGKRYEYDDDIDIEDLDEEDLEEEEEIEEGEEYDEDEELLENLEAKYDKSNKQTSNRKDEIKQVRKRESESDTDNNAEYKNAGITSKEDWEIRDDLDKAQNAVKENAAYAIKLFDKILQKNPSSPRGIYGKAHALSKLADLRKSNEILQTAIAAYIQLFNLATVPDDLFKIAAEEAINRMRFIGHFGKAVKIHLLLTNRFPNNSSYRNQLAITYLTINRINEARQVLKETLAKWPNDGSALVHYGFILKTTDNNLREAVSYLEKGINTKEEGVIDGRFFFHLGDALTRLGNTTRAMEIYKEGVKHNLFLSKYQRSLYNVNRLTGRPWWKKSQTPYQSLFNSLESNWKEIRKEGLAILNKKKSFVNESENLKNTGDWKQFELFARGRKNVENCKKCPITCSIIEKYPEAGGCKRGQTKFSVMHPGTHVWPHCGPTNCRLRAHLGLKVPPGTYIRVAEETRSWEEGKIIIFDDSFEHEVWHNGSEFRLVLIVDVWHPELTQSERRGLSPI